MLAGRTTPGYHLATCLPWQIRNILNLTTSDHSSQLFSGFISIYYASKMFAFDYNIQHVLINNASLVHTRITCIFLFVFLPMSILASKMFSIPFLSCNKLNNKYTPKLTIYHFILDADFVIRPYNFVRMCRVSLSTTCRSVAHQYVLQ